MKAPRRVFRLLSALCLVAAVSRGAYTVRDTGFVDPAPEPFVLQLPAATDPSEFQEAERRLHAAGYLVEPAPRPSARLTAPGGAVLDLGTEPGADERSLASPVRAALPAQLIDNLAVVVVVEGTDAGLSGTAGAAVSEAVEGFRRRVQDGGLAATREPVVVTLPAVAREAETVLLWALGLAELPPSLPAVAVLYGRGRQLGPVLSGADLTAAAVQRRLDVLAGAWDESLERGWVRGATVPLAWDGGVRAAAAAALPFDPDDEVVRAEVGQLISRLTEPAPAPVPVATVVPPPAPKAPAPAAPAATVPRDALSDDGFLNPWILGPGLGGVLLFGLLYAWLARPPRR